jgi:type IV secretion system protein VirB8
MGLRDWELVFVMSTDPVAQSMRVRYAGNNPQNPFVMYGRERAIRVKILSITPLGAEPNGSFRGASVRIQRSLLDKRTGVSTYLDNQLVTMRFQYNQNLALSEQDRILNPGVPGHRVPRRQRLSRGVPVPDDGAMQAQAAAGRAGRAAGAGCLRSQQSGRGHDDRSGHRPAGRGAGQRPGAGPECRAACTGATHAGSAGAGASNAGAGHARTAGHEPAQNNSTGTADGASNR